jgi:hypothetical protein
MLMLLYFLITKLYSLIALWKPRRISSQMKQYNADMSHLPVYVQQGETAMEPYKDS